MKERKHYAGYHQNGEIDLKQVISFSRRTDGPAYYMDKFEKALSNGSIDVQNPINRKYYRVSLKPDDVAGFVFWSKNFRPLLNKWDVVDDFLNRNQLIPSRNEHVFFHFTRNSPNSLFEPRVPGLDESFSQVQELVELTSPRHVAWRFDPIIFWRKDGIIHNNTGSFSEIASFFADFKIKTCIISFVTYYKKVKQRMKRKDIAFHEPAIREIINVGNKLKSMAKDNEISIRVCCNPRICELLALEPASCIDGHFLTKLWGEKLSVAKDSGQRTSCGCTKSRDIGGYGKEWECKSGCLYCYANPCDG